MTARRSSFEDEAVDYAAVGATQRSDLMQYPPEGYVPSEDEFRLGSGEERFALATSALLTWGLHRSSGVEITDVHPGTGVQYGGIAFAEDGTPLEPIETHEEQRFAEDGTPFITPGTTVVFAGSVGGEPLVGPHRVISVTEEPGHVSLAIGTMDGDPESGEQSFTIEQREDDSVWIVVRSFFRPTKGAAKLVGSKRRRKTMNDAYLRALLPSRGL
ncbi:DUF1990 family protein [Plantibacter sp. LMC-P-059a]|jgi:uncharacterized protein (UPF0548 family)|uniref:DUF1990 family protein n=1 Tax=unclassified Plantibacter TaxID=2624265 RepID=UPI00254FF48A|nr:DUF1990 family protein [Plantibacter sp. LMC-P-059a]